MIYLKNIINYIHAVLSCEQHDGEFTVSVQEVGGKIIIIIDPHVIDPTTFPTIKDYTT